MSAIRFEWDEVKNASNQTKHGISFEDVFAVFFDSHALLIADPDHSQAEERFLLLGRNQKGRVLTISHCYRKDDSTVRIISARRASHSELNAYYSEWNP